MCGFGYWMRPEASLGLRSSIGLIESLPVQLLEVREEEPDFRNFIKPARASAAARPNDLQTFSTKQTPQEAQHAPDHSLTHTHTHAHHTLRGKLCRNSLCVWFVAQRVHHQAARRAPWRGSPAPENVVNFRLSGRGCSSFGV